MLAMWIKQYLSKGERPTFIKRTLLRLSIYQMSFFDMLERVSLRVEKIQKNFLWGRDSLEKKSHLVQWDIAYKEKFDRGLSIRKLSILNKALLEKWLWRFASKNESLWKRVIVKKYEEVEGADVQGKVGMEMELGCRKSTGVGRITLVEEPLSIRPRVEG